jgi:protein O-GlcNAc transferase
MCCCLRELLLENIQKKYPVNSLKPYTNSVNISEAVALHKKGMLSEAKQIYNQYIKLNPSNDRVFYLWGLAEYQEKNYRKAIEFFQRAIGLSPRSAEYFKDLGNCYKHIEKYDLALFQYQKALYINSQFTEAYYDMGILHLIKDEWELSISCFKKAISFNPKFTDAYINLGIAQQKKGDLKKAISSLLQAKKLRPNDELIYLNLGNTFLSLGNISQALLSFKKAILFNPLSAEAYCNMGMTYREIRRYFEAIDCFEKAITANPLWENPYTFLGSIYQRQGKCKSALIWLNKALKINVNNAFTHAIMGQVYLDDGQEKEAISSFKTAVKLDPKFVSAYSGIVRAMLNACIWNDLRKYSHKLDILTSGSLSDLHQVYETPFLNLIRHSDSKLNLQIAKAHSQYVRQKIDKYKIKFNDRTHQQRGKKIHLGYISNNFRDHPTANLLLDIFEAHDRDQFEVSCYSYGPDDKSNQRKHIEAACDHFIDIDKLSDIDAANKIHDDKVDILIDLVGYLMGSRIEISAFHPAPLQIRWLGMAGTTGSDFFEYLIADKIIIPEQESKYYSEQLIYLPECYQLNSYKYFPIEKTKKSKWGLPPDYFIFCSFNTTYKLDPLIFRCWLNILKKVPKSLLWLLVQSDYAKENLKRYSEECNIESERILFAERLTRKMHLQRLSCADLALDTFVVNGAATTSDALWAGVPVLTIKGDHFASRMSASILNAIGMSELIFNNMADYQGKAIELAQNSTAMKDLKNRLLYQRDSSQLFETNRSLRLLERAYKMCWNLYQTKKPPQLLKVCK